MADGSTGPAAGGGESGERRGLVHRLIRAAVVGLEVLGILRAAVPERAPELALPDVAAGPPPDEVHHPDGRIEHPAVRYERTDVRRRGVVIVILLIAGIASFHFWIVWWFFWDYSGYEAAMKKSSFPLAPEPSMRLPAEPRLEQLDRLAGVERPDVYLRLEDKEGVLHGLGPTAQAGFVHIPIERAMALVVGTLPPSPPPAVPIKSNGLLDGGGPNSGRLFQGER